MFKFFAKKKSKEQKEQDDIEWMINAFSSSIEPRQNRIVRFHAEGNVDLLLTNHIGQLHDLAWLSLALWRQRQDPRETIRSLVEQYAQFQSHVSLYDPNDQLGLRNNYNYIFSQTDLIDALGWLAGITSKVTDVPRPEANFFYSCSNYLLRQAIGIDGAIEDRERFLAQLEVGSSLPKRILVDRAKILGVIETDEPLELLVERSDASWEERRASAFFKKYGIRSGYSASNYRDVDYYLAVALKKVGYEGDTIHKWIW